MKVAIQRKEKEKKMTMYSFSVDKVGNGYCSIVRVYKWVVGHKYDRTGLFLEYWVRISDVSSLGGLVFL